MFKNLYLTNRFFILIGTCIALFLLSYAFDFLFGFAKVLLVAAFILAFADWIFLYFMKSKIEVQRSVYEKLSLGDRQKVTYHISNTLSTNLKLEVFDEYPPQLQLRNSSNMLDLEPMKDQRFSQAIRPLKRGIYAFGDLQVYLSSPYLGLTQVKKTISAQKEVAVIPSIIQMKKFELQVFSKTATMSGIRRIRQIGENDEFEHIKAYSQGDNIRAINWKATSRKNQLMVNQFQNTRSQMVYCLIDKGRSMKMPFNELSLLDYSINASLVLSNIILRKHDKAGLITFSDKIGSIVKAEASQNQLEKINGTLYKQKTGFLESNFELLFYTLRKYLSRRSIILLFTNFEHKVDLERNLSYLKGLNKKHLLVVISFINTELTESSEMECNNMSDIYFKTFAKKTLLEKEKIMAELDLHGIQNILTRPQDLNINVINKYLEIKAKRAR